MPKHNPTTQAIDADTLAAAEKLIGLRLTDDERQLMLDELNGRLTHYEALRAVTPDNDVPPFDPRPPATGLATPRRPLQPSALPDLQRPEKLEQLAFYTVPQLAQLLRARRVSSLELTQMYLKRLKRYDPQLRCVITLTEALALEQARRADAEIAKGHYRGPLHGIPWGAKDLLAVKNYPTTWGATPYKEQTLDLDATVVQRLEAAGAVLLAKLSLGALAWGDVWFDGVTKSPWDVEQGSSGSSAGPASATAAGLVGFSLGSETLGSIVSPCTRCATTGLRPTFGRVSRHGAMALSWSMDKLGPICRSVAGCAQVFDAIYGPDGKDNTLVEQALDWNARPAPNALRVGYVKEAFEAEREGKAFDEHTLDALKALGVTLVPIDLPSFPYDALRTILVAEAAAAFDGLTRSGRDELLVRQEAQAWPNVFRQARFIPAVEYLQAQRVRTLLVREVDALMETLDVYVCPSFGGENLTLTNLSGHPAVVVPNGFDEKGVPTSSMTFTGKRYGEVALLALAEAYQQATDFHAQHPKLDFSP